VIEAIDLVASVAGELREPGIVADARDLAARAAEGRFYLACIGQFKRGKSTLINALLGGPVLPVGVVPVTSAITTISHSAESGARVRFDDGRVADISVAEIAAFVTEAANPGNVKGVRAVEVGVPSEILRGGVCLVDTPGIGSVFGGNTAVTRGFVPRIDAALVVIGAEPPIAGDEVALVSEVASETSALMFVLNKRDRSTPDERKDACAFAQRVLRDTLGRPVDRIFEVSALAALSGDTDAEWTALVHAIRTLVQGRDALLGRRVERRTAALRAQLLDVIEERDAALRRPLQESEQHIATLRTAVAAAEQSLGDLAALLATEEGRLTSALRARRDAFLEHAGSLARERLTDALETQTAGDARRAALEEARSIARRSVSSWGASLERDAAELYERAMRRFSDLAAEFLERTPMGTAGARSARRLDPDFRLGAPPHFYFTEMMSVAPVSALAWLDRALPVNARRRRAVAAASAYLERLLETNASRFVNDLIERVGRSRSALETDVRHTLRDVVVRAETALASAQRAHEAGRAEVDAEIARLRQLRRQLDAIPLNDALAEVAS
jgi:predicted GTPase